ncbi:rab3 GTPase-activating protein catalytic subunit [Ischnura elegans]|uniref:rab3 GTPase-activating protein catalytic subunit n=1 Tax=Ischnura elegans TaxID=197161 RepID=UPI001ED87FDF|nr:rab3 GTPase-activating protein catalytic subunit [Ischnura elegans]
MSDDIDDSVVHHDDFTLSTEWEKFIDRLEKVIFKWRLSESKFRPTLTREDYLNGSWETVTEPVDFADFKFDIRKYTLKVRGDGEDEKCTPVSPVSEEDNLSEASPRAYENHLDLNSNNNIFLPFKEVGSPDMFHIVRWYGLREFLVLSPQPRHSIASESRLKILLSSVLIAVNNCSCSVPVFVQFHHPNSHYFVGVSEGSEGIRVDFEMAHLNSPPPGSHLSGLLDMFKYKIRDPTALKGPVQVSAQFTYKLKNQFIVQEHPVEYNFEKLPFKMYNLNSWEIHLMATWPQLPEDAVIDRVGSSSFHPLSAPSWSLRMPLLSFPYRVLRPNRSPSNTQIGEYPSLAKYLMECMSCTKISRAHDSVLDTSIVKLIGGAEPDNVDAVIPAKAALDILTTSKVSGFTKVMNNATKSRLQKLWHGNKMSQAPGSGQSKKSDVVEEGPIPDDVLLAILHYLFPDADEMHVSSYPDGFTQGASDSESSQVKVKNPTQKKECPWLGKHLKVGSLLKSVDPKTCPKDGLVWRLTKALALVHQTLGGPMAVAHLWYEVAQEARYRWDKLIPLPGLIPGEPNHKTSLLHQKFQMLNCCIDRRKREIDARKNPPSHSSSFNFDSEASEDEDDNFFDCPEDLPEDEEDDSKEETTSKVQVPRMKHSLWNRPEGRLEKMEDICILSTGEPLYVPITQEIPPKTEDQLEEDAELMLMLGNDSLGAELRATIMSASLLSDMESFKAANPSAELIDFIRWYSPRDWVEEEVLNEFGQKKGHLSERMLLPGNKWQEVWSAAKPVPARRQKRLFNDGCEAEKVLHFLETLSVSKIFRNILPILLQAALCRIGEEMDQLEPPEEEVDVVRVENDEKLEGEASKDDQDKCDIEFMEMKNFSDRVLEELNPEDIILPHYVPHNLKRIVSRVRNISLNPLGVDPEFYTDLIFEMGKIESLVSMARGAQRQFNLDKEKLKTKEYFSFLKSLAGEEEAQIEGGRQSLVGELIWNFIQKERTMEGRLLDEHFHAERKEYVLQVMASRPTPYSRPTPQRLTAVVKEGEFRLAGAFSQDTVFF